MSENLRPKILKSKNVGRTTIELEYSPEKWCVIVGGCLYEFPSKEEAEKFFREKVKEVKEEHELMKSQEIFEILKGVWLSDQLRRYVERLKERKNHYRKWKGISEEEAKRIDECRKLLKGIIHDLEDLMTVKRKLVWDDIYNYRWEIVDNPYDEVMDEIPYHGIPLDLGELKKAIEKAKRILKENENED
ncbi:MAG TPA: hypothetical protein ENG34_00860 [Candidatus Aenigmarchaeota archaeon]|nr:hypothetical protein [Candidatus Aenigmarchaeota archaeon]